MNSILICSVSDFGVRQPFKIVPHVCVCVCVRESKCELYICKRIFFLLMISRLIMTLDREREKKKIIFESERMRKDIKRVHGEKILIVHCIECLYLGVISWVKKWDIKTEKRDMREADWMRERLDWRLKFHALCLCNKLNATYYIAEAAEASHPIHYILELRFACLRNAIARTSQWQTHIQDKREREEKTTNKNKKEKLSKRPFSIIVMSGQQVITSLR